MTISRLPPLPIRASALALACALAGCSTYDKVKDSAVGAGGGVQAVMQPVRGMAGQMDVRFVDRGDGAYVSVFATNLLPGVYRLAIHETGNCSSPNLFSAGPPWAPPGSAIPPGEMIGELRTNSEGDGTWTMQVHGVHTKAGPDGLMGRSMVLHWGRAVGPAEPGVPNDRVMCGVIGPLRSFFDES
jgi:superoxide dismutase, Cu-Zn family